jgi:hypothetical protein
VSAAESVSFKAPNTSADLGVNLDEHKRKSVIENTAKNHDRLLQAVGKQTRCDVGTHDFTHIGVGVERFTAKERGP